MSHAGTRYGGRPRRPVSHRMAALYCKCSHHRDVHTESGLCLGHGCKCRMLKLKCPETKEWKVA